MRSPNLATAGNSAPITGCDDAPPLPASLLAGLTLEPVAAERGGLVWCEAAQMCVWEEDAVTVTF